MKILSCYINNFGIFSDKEFIFKNGLNEICEDNGWGKSTLTSFIRVMLYGFENESAKSKSQRERFLLKPWQGGIYGGTLNIQIGNTRYSITRTFGDKSSDDIVEVRDLDTNILTDELGDNIGETIFQLDSQSFKRTSFISQSDCGTQVGSNINAKLGNLSDNSDDINRYESVEKKINDILNSLTPDRKTGLIKGLKTEISEKESDIRDKESLENISATISEKILDLRSQLQNIKDEQNSISQELTKESEYQQSKSLKEKYEMLIKELAEREQVLADARHVFPNQVPTSDEIEKQQELCREILSINGEYSQCKLTDEELADLKELDKYFNGRVPSDQDFNKAYDDLSIIDSLRYDIDNKKMSADSVRRFKELSIKLGGNIPPIREIDELLANLSDRVDKVQEIKQKQSQLRIYQEEQSRREAEILDRDKKNRRFSIITGITLLIMGIIVLVLFEEEYYMGFVPAVAGLSLIVYGIKSRTKIEKDDRTISLEQEIQDDQSFVDLISRDLDSFKRRYEWDYETAQISYSLLDMKKAILEFNSLRKEKDQDQTEPLTERCEKIRQELISFVRQYEPELSEADDKLSRAIPVIENKRKEYVRLSSQYAQASSLEERLDVKERKLSAFLLSNGYESEDYAKDLSDINDKLSAYIIAKNEVTRAEHQKLKFEQEVPNYDELLGMAEPAEDNTIISLNERRLALEESEESIRSSIEAYERQLEEKQVKLQGVYEKEAELEILYDKLAKATDDYNLYQLTRSYLARAKENLTNKYTGPIMSSFKKHIATLTGEDSDKYHLDANIHMTKTELGLQREIESMSRGQQDLVGICMRMALIDAMYGAEKPFIIFDDPFTNFDSAKTSNGMEFIRKLSQDYQILYFTCHDSRRSVK